MIHERRFQRFDARATASSRTLRGYAALFNSWSETLGGGRLGGFRERFMPGAFAAALRVSDVRALVDHDPSKILARNTSGTLQLREDDIGLLVNIDVPRTSLGNDILESVSRGDVSQMSLAFTIADGGDEWNADFTERTIHEVDKLFDVSVMTYPAYTATSIGVRSAAAGNPESKYVHQASVQARVIHQQARFRSFSVR